MFTALFRLPFSLLLANFCAHLATAGPYDAYIAKGALQFMAKLSVSERNKFISLMTSANLTKAEAKSGLQAWAQKNKLVGQCQNFTAKIQAKFTQFEAAAQSNLAGAALEAFQKIVILHKDESLNRRQECLQIRSVLNVTDKMGRLFLPSSLVPALYCNSPFDAVGIRPAPVVNQTQRDAEMGGEQFGISYAENEEAEEDAADQHILLGEPLARDKAEQLGDASAVDAENGTDVDKESQVDQQQQQALAAARIGEDILLL